MPQPLDQFVKQLALSTLLADDEVTAFLAGMSHQPPDGDSLARELVRQKKLTAFQAQQIYAGKAKALVLGNYVILDKLGQGGMGMVLKALHRRMERLVALKVLSPAIVKTPDALRRFQREVKAAARLTHPNIVIAHDADEAGGTHFLVMEYVEGADLSSLVKKSGPLPPEKALTCLIQAARGLEYAHAQGIVHRDIKPANLLLDSKGTIKILDMGLARLDSAAARQDDLTGTGQIMGTVDYMAPEQAASTKSADHRADIYSLGVTLWYLLTGQPLYDGETVIEKLLAHQSKPVPPLPLPLGEGWGEGAARLNAVFQKMVAKAPADRYPSMTEVIAALESCRTGGGTTPTVSLSQAWAGAAHAEPGTRTRAGRSGTAPQELRPPKVAKPATSPILDETLNVAPPSVDTDPTTNLHVGQPLVSAPAATSAKKPAAKSARSNRPLILYGSIGAGILAVVGITAFMLSFFGGGNEPKKIDQGNPKPVSAGPVAASTDHALQFDGQTSYVEIAPFNIDPQKPLTIEAYATPARPAQLAAMLRLYGQPGFSLYQTAGRAATGLFLPVGQSYLTGPPLSSGQRVHLAAVWQNSQVSFYVDGKPHTTRASLAHAPDRSQRLFLGGQLDDPTESQPAFLWAGVLDEIRISQSARYVQEFTPRPRFENDADTLALYHCDAGTGDVLTDDSGHGHDGTIVGAKWVRVDGLPPPTSFAGDMPSTAKLAQLAISGVWLNDGGAIVSPVVPYAQLALPGKPRANSANKLTLEVTREAGTGPLVLGLPIGSGRCVATIDNTAAHEVTIGDLPVPAPIKYFPGLARGQSARIEILFSPNGISITIDGKMVLDHQGSLSGATTPTRWQTTEPNVLFLGASLSRFRITRLEAGTP